MPPKKYTTEINDYGQTVYSVYKVWRKEPESGYVSFSDPAEARAFYEKHGARLDLEEITVIATKDQS